METNLAKLWFSQASISAWLNCSLKFKYRYIDGLYWPMPTGGAVGEHIEMGRKFHLLAQQYYSDSQVDLPPGNDELQKWLTQLKKYLPKNDKHRFLPEYELRANHGSLRLLAKYDLLVASESGITIYDWKTEDKPPRPALASSVQTRLYLYLLSLTDYFVTNPQDMRMVYWNPRYPKEPLLITYSQQQKEQDGIWISKQVEDISASSVFPATTDERNCRFCEYRPVCHGKGLEVVDAEFELDEIDWDQIQEITLQGVNLP